MWLIIYASMSTYLSCLLLPCALEGLPLRVNDGGEFAGGGRGVAHPEVGLHVRGELKEGAGQQCLRWEVGNGI